MERCKTYVGDGGVDLIWLNTVKSAEQIKIACAEIPAPVLTIWAGKPPAPTHEELERLGLRSRSIRSWPRQPSRRRPGRY